MPPVGVFLMFATGRGQVHKGLLRREGGLRLGVGCLCGTSGGEKEHHCRNMAEGAGHSVEGRNPQHLLGYFPGWSLKSIDLWDERVCYAWLGFYLRPSQLSIKPGKRGCPSSTPCAHGPQCVQRTAVSTRALQLCLDTPRPSFPRRGLWSHPGRPGIVSPRHP